MNPQINFKDRQRLAKWYERNKQAFEGGERPLSAAKVADKYRSVFDDCQSTHNTIMAWVKAIRMGRFSDYMAKDTIQTDNNIEIDYAYKPDFSDPLQPSSHEFIELPESWAEPTEHYTISGVTNLGVGNDFHFPYHDKFAVQAWVSEMKRREVDGLYLNGDIMDFEKISKYGQMPDGRYLKDEIEVGRKFIESLRKMFPTIPIYWKDGNHEYRLERYIQSKCPELANLYGMDVRTQMRLDDLGVIHIPEYQLSRFGKLWIAHGHELGLKSGSVYVARAVRLRVMANIMFGHFHRDQVDFATTLDGIHGSWAIGTLGYLKPRYIGAVGQWTQGGATVRLHEDGKSFTVSAFQIRDGVVK